MSFIELTSNKSVERKHISRMSNDLRGRFLCREEISDVKKMSNKFDRFAAPILAGEGGSLNIHFLARR